MAWRARRLADRLDGRTSLALDYPTSAANRPRYGYERPAHPTLAAIIRRHEDRYRETLASILRHRAALARISGSGTYEPQWKNPYLPALDAAALYALIREHGSRRYVEIGSGHSTRFVARAKRDAGLRTEIVSIDPRPRAEIEPLCDVTIRQPLENADLSVFKLLQRGDVVFMDGSHRVFMNSDTTVFFLDVLPGLAPGVIVGIHDIYLPDDYDPWEIDDYYSEQYLLAVALLADPDGLQPILPADYIGKHDELKHLLDPLWNEPALAGADHHGCAFWFERE